MKSTFSVIFYLKRQAVKKTVQYRLWDVLQWTERRRNSAANFRSILNCGTRKADVSREEVQPHLKQTACLTDACEHQQALSGNHRA